MAITEKPKLIHWNYFLSLDSDAEKLSRYVEFTEKNFETYSIEMVRLLLSASSEVDVIARQLCIKIDKNINPDNIKMNDYRIIINPKYTKIKEMKIEIQRYGLELTPWDEWKKDKSPVWWTEHNKVKHQRNINFQKANLKNTLNSIAGLFCLLLYYYKDETEEGLLISKPNLFSVSREFHNNIFSIPGRPQYKLE